jgi:hypothetical protein
VTLVTVAAAACGANSCPTVYLDKERKVAIVQGYKVQTSEYNLDIPPSETVVEIPWSLLVEATHSPEVIHECATG